MATLPWLERYKSATNFYKYKTYDKNDGKNKLEGAGGQLVGHPGFNFINKCFWHEFKKARQFYL